MAVEDGTSTVLTGGLLTGGLLTVLLSPPQPASETTPGNNTIERILMNVFTRLPLSPRLN
jgi:hypothetical protein